MSSVAGFDFNALNRSFIIRPVNLATGYGAQIALTAPAPVVWRCIGVYHLLEFENRSRRNVFCEVLDETGSRLRSVSIQWRWHSLGPDQKKSLDKPDNEPACDIPLDINATVMLWVGDSSGVLSDVVTGLHSKHPDEGDGNRIGHHSYYVVFQRQRANVVVTPLPPVLPGPTVPTDPAPAIQDIYVSQPGTILRVHGSVPYRLEVLNG